MRPIELSDARARRILHRLKGCLRDQDPVAAVDAVLMLFASMLMAIADKPYGWSVVEWLSGIVEELPENDNDEDEPS